MSVQQKKFLLGVTGSIAAYKAASIVRLLIKAGAQVRVLMTPAATQFITPLTLSTLSKHAVYTDINDGGSWSNHVELGLWADAMLIAPASANTISKMAVGGCDNMVTACYLSARCPVFVAPAMDLDMWVHKSTQHNIKTLESHGVHLLPVEDGELASGLYGKGRMAEPEQIVAFLDDFFNQKLLLKGKKALVNAGPTYEAIDPVRFIGNRSSGKMGIAIAETLAAKGAEVTLVLGPTHLRPENIGIRVVSVESAHEMLAACEKEFENTDIAVFSAAVADYTPENPATQKIKKSNEKMDLHLIKNPDIAKILGMKKKPNQISVGFALETENEIQHAVEKLDKKNLDLVVLNSVNDIGATFGHDTNKIYLIDRQRNIQEFPLKSKIEVAQDIVAKICSLVQSK